MQACCFGGMMAKDQYPLPRATPPASRPQPALTSWATTQPSAAVQAVEVLLKVALPNLPTVPATEFGQNV